MIIQHFIIIKLPSILNMILIKQLFIAEITILIIIITKYNGVIFVKGAIICK